jgi:hypothetical protein
LKARKENPFSNWLLRCQLHIEKKRFSFIGFDIKAREKKKSLALKKAPQHSAQRH